MFVKTDKQKELYEALANTTTVLAEGGGRSGKTIAIVRYIFMRGIKYPGTDHLIGRFRFSHAKQAICYQTVPKLSVIEDVNFGKFLNKTDWFYTLTNGSRIWITGFDDKERTEKILGNEYATIFHNEASQISFETREMVLTRLNPPPGVPAKEIIDYNPPSVNHWGYKVFHKRKFPDGRDVPADDYKFVRMNPADNPHNSPEYIKILDNMSAQKRKRFRDGEYGTDSGSLWRRAWIAYDNADYDYERIVIGVDPSGTVEGDAIGIVVAGKISSDEYRIIDDYSCHGTPAEWAAEVAAAYDKWQADLVVAEKNYGGDMVEHTIRTAASLINVRLIISSRGKILRAEPISALYEKGKVKHRVPFYELEDEYCTYEKESDFSPNRMDAAVFALTELSGSGPNMLDAV